MNTPALSTMWMQQRFSRVREFVEAGKRLGFEKFELGHVVRPEMLDGLARQDAEFPSIHAPCPSTIGLGHKEGIVVSSLDEDQRQEAVRLTVKTMDLAEKLGATAVIVHVGHVETGRHINGELRSLYISQQEEAPRFHTLRQQFVEARAARASLHLEPVRRSLEELTREAGQRGLHLAMENRVYYHEIPLPDEARTLLGEFETLHYWHDTGHAQVLQNLGFVRHEDWLETFQDRMLGIHLHDVLGIRDHLVCGLGEIDWRWIVGYLEPDTLRTCEFDYYFEGAHLQQGVEFLRAAGWL
jgi:sugar phosphate isomerase/epimerase